MAENLNYQLGLLHFSHLLISIDGFIDDRERKILSNMRIEEQIAESTYAEFEKSILKKTDRQLYVEGIDLLSECTEQEKLCAFVQLYRVSEADGSIHEKEVRFLLFSLKETQIDFEDVLLAARMAQASQSKKQTEKVKVA